MIYNGNIEYNQNYFQYDGIYVVSPESFNIPINFGNLNLLKVLVISPASIDSTLVFVSSPNVIIPSGIIEDSETSSSIQFTSFNGYGSTEIEKINNDAYALSSLGSDESKNLGYIAISVDKNDAYAFSSAERIIIQDNGAGTIDVTIISNA